MDIIDTYMGIHINIKRRKCILLTTMAYIYMYAYIHIYKYLATKMHTAEHNGLHICTNKISIFFLRKVSTYNPNKSDISQLVVNRSSVLPSLCVIACTLKKILLKIKIGSLFYVKDYMKTF